MLDKFLLQQMIDEKLVFRQKHPNAELYIYNYSPKVQYEKLWNSITIQTRGLILDGEMNVIAKPFPKFWNLGEHSPDEIPNESFDVYEKMDGSLLIVFFYIDKWFTATRGSFTSVQALKGKELLNKYNLDLLDKNKTYCFEIIY